MNIKLTNGKSLKYVVTHSPIAAPSPFETGKKKPQPRVTEAMVTLQFPSGIGLTTYGRSACNPLDQFSRREGTKRAMAQALADMSEYLTKDERRSVWSRVWNGKYDAAQKQGATLLCPGEAEEAFRRLFGESEGTRG